MPNDATETPEDERQTLAALVTQYQGNLSAIARALSEGARKVDASAAAVTRQVVTRKLSKHHLTKVAERARARGGVSGPRPGMVGGVRGEKASIERALIDCDGYRGAAKKLGISPRTMIRKMKAHGIDMAKVKEVRAKSAAVSAELAAERKTRKTAL